MTNLMQPERLGGSSAPRRKRSLRGHPQAQASGDPPRSYRWKLHWRATRAHRSRASACRGCMDGHRTPPGSMVIRSSNDCVMVPLYTRNRGDFAPIPFFDRQSGSVDERLCSIPRQFEQLSTSPKCPRAPALRLEEQIDFAAAARSRLRAPTIFESIRKSGAPAAALQSPAQVSTQPSPRSRA